MKPVTGFLPAVSVLWTVLMVPSMATASQYFFPQVVDGKSPGLVYITSFLLNNVLDSRNTVTITLYQKNGAPWALQLQSHDRPEVAGRSPSFSFVLDGRETLNLSTIGADPIATGWAKIESTQPLNVSEIFSSIRPSSPLQAVTWEAGILAAPASGQFSFEAAYSAGETVEGTTVNTGYAIANPNGVPVTITATLISRNGGQIRQKVITLDPNAQISEFFTQRFSEIVLPDKFHGLIRLTSSSNIALCALRSSSSPTSDVYSTIAVNPDFSLGAHIYSDMEPNNSISTAQPILLPAEIVGAKNAADIEPDVDYFSINLRAGQTFTALMVADLMGSPFDGTIFLFDSALNQLARSDNWATGIKDPGYSLTLNSSGLFYVVIASGTGADTSGASYRLFLMAR